MQAFLDGSNGEIFAKGTGAEQERTNLSCTSRQPEFFVAGLKSECGKGSTRRLESLPTRDVQKPFLKPVFAYYFLFLHIVLYYFCLRERDPLFLFPQIQSHCCIQRVYFYR